MKPITKFLFSIPLIFLSSCSGNGGGSTMSTSTTKPIDYSKYPLYVKNVDNIQYDFNDANLSNPFWKGNIIYNETVLLCENTSTGEISGCLAYTPKKIISVRDFTLKNKVFIEGTDFEVSGNKLIKKSGSDMPYLKDITLTGEYLPEGYRLTTNITNQLTDCVLMGGTYYTESPLYYGNQVSVTYVYDVAEIDDHLDIFPTFNLDKLPKTKAKLEAKENLIIAGIGDSVLEGCSSSKKFNHEPFMDSFFDLLKPNLEKLYGGTITSKNLSVGGTQSAWGALPAQINSIVATKCDLLFIHFGINDLGDGKSARTYYENIEGLILNLRARLPEVEVCIISPFGPNPNIYDYEKLNSYIKKVKEEIVEKVEGVDLLDIFPVSKELMKNKKYHDLCANGINHLNDFSSRICLSSILAKFYQYK